MNRAIISKARCILSNVGLHRYFWAEVAFTACYLINWFLSIAIEQNTVINELSSTLDDYLVLRVFECLVYAHVNNGTSEPRAIKCIFLSYKLVVKLFKLWNYKAKKMVISRNIIFNEILMIHDDALFNTLIDVSVESRHKSNIEVEHIIDSSDKKDVYVHDDRYFCF